MTLNLNNDTEILKKNLNIMKKSTDYSMTTDYNNRVVKIHFHNNVPTEKRNKVKGAILKENTEILIADMKSEYNVKTQKFDLVPCDIILSVKGAESLQDFKARLINIYKSEFNILSPCPCPGGERIVITLKRGNGKEEIKFLTVSLWNKDSKIMVQGTSDNLDRFITDYIEEKRKEKNFLNNLKSIPQKATSLLKKPVNSI